MSSPKGWKERPTLHYSMERCLLQVLSNFRKRTFLEALLHIIIQDCSMNTNMRGDRGSPYMETAENTVPCSWTFLAASLVPRLPLPRVQLLRDL